MKIKRKTTPTIKNVDNFTKTGIFFEHSSQNYSAEFDHLSNYCVSVAGTYYVKVGTKWSERTKLPSVISDLLNHHSQFKDPSDGKLKMISGETVKKYLSTSILNMDATTYAPLCSDFVKFNHENRLNLYVDRRIEGDDQDIAVIEPVLQMIRNGLCGKADFNNLDQMLFEIKSDQASLFKWVIHYLANRYQRPGSNLQTNLWFVGGRGIGKGTLIKIMRTITGSVKKVEAGDIEARQWTGSLYAADIFEWDEFTSGSRYDFNTFVKTITGNDTLNITLRGIGEKLHPACSSHIFCSNQDAPILIDSDDRQNTFCASVRGNPDDPVQDALYKRSTTLARTINDLEDAEFDRIVSGFAALLGSIELDLKFIAKPFITELRDRLIQPDNISNEDIVEEWLKDSLIQMQGASPADRQKRNLYTDYRNYMREVYPKRSLMAEKSLFKQLKTNAQVKEKFTTINDHGLKKTIRYYDII